MIQAIVSLLGGFIELVVGLRFIFRLLGANPTNGFVGWVYNVSHPLVTPFTGIFGQSVTTPGITTIGVFEWASIIALIVYAIIAGIILSVLGTRTRGIPV